MSELILSDADLKAEGHWPVVCVLGSYEGRSREEHEEFPDLLGAISKGEGYNADEKGCAFWDELDEFEKVREGRFDVECYAVDGVCRLTSKEFYGYLEIACKRYARRYPSAWGSLEESLARYRRRFL